MIYLDNAATSYTRPAEVEQEMTQALHSFGNPGRGAHEPTLRAARVVFDTRRKLADLIHADSSSNIAFTCNATEALNIAIQGLIGPKDHVITSECEHNSVLRPLYKMQRRGAELSFLKADENGVLDPEQLEGLKKENTKAVVITHASNLTGNITDLEKVSRFTKKHGIILVVDASQTIGCIPIDVQKYAIDILCFAGHKGLMGPQGTGAIYVREGIKLDPLKVGGSGFHSYSEEHPAKMPTALEAGTLNSHGIAGLHGALSWIEKTGIENIQKKETALWKAFYEGIRDIPGLRIYGDFQAKERTPVIAVNLENVDSASLCDWLWEDYGICVRAGAHCAPLIHRALGTEEQGAVRFSFSYFNTMEDINLAIQALTELAADE